MSTERRTLLVTGYWPPTNEMIRQFSANPGANPSGWQGGNWRGRGFDIYAFFPEFPGETFPKGVGDFQIDYQVTSSDWWRITDLLRPFAIITFSRGHPDNSWEVEALQRNLAEWRPDYQEPHQPTPSPPDASTAAGTIRISTLPMTEIVRRVNDADLGITAFIDQDGFGGAFLSEFIAYHGVWYQALHSHPSDAQRCVAAGHIHVGMEVTVEQGVLATEITLEALIDYLELVTSAFGGAGLSEFDLPVEQPPFALPDA